MRIVSRALGRIWPGRRSCLEELCEEYGHETVRSVYDRVRDRRTLLTALAEQRGSPHAQELARLSRRLGLTVAERLSPLDLIGVHSLFGVTLSDLRACGAIPQTLNGEVTSLACIDPDLLAGLDELIGRKLPRVMAGWEQIQNCISMSERMVICLDRGKSSPDPFNGYEMAAAVLSFLAWQAETLDATEAALVRSGDGCRYRVIPPLGQSIQGSLASWIIDILREMSIRQAQPLRVSSPDGLTVQRVGITVVDNEARLRFGEPCDLPSVRTVAGAAEVAILDADPFYRRATTAALARQGIEALSARDAAELAATFEQRSPPRVVLADLESVCRNKRSLLTLLRGEPRWREVALIVLSHESAPALELDLLRSGADLVLSKSVDSRLLMAHVVNSLARRERRA